MRLRLALPVLVIAALAVPGTASAAIVVSGQSEDNETLVYKADSGEQNRLNVSRSGDSVVFDDPGAHMRPDDGRCSVASETRMSCQLGPVIEISGVCKHCRE